MAESLNWQHLQSVTPGAAKQLADLFACWCDQPLTLCLEGTDALLLLLQACTPMGDHAVPPYWWQWRLDAMRLLRLPDEFELVALDFCVTYELSPPSWVVPRGERIDRPAPQGSALPSGSPVGLPESRTTPKALTDQPEQMSPGKPADPQLALTGDVLGDSEHTITSLRAAATGHEVCVVSCADLIRVDFSAAGSLLNWVANAEAQGERIEFRDVPRLVAAFFNLIGIKFSFLL